MKRFSFGVAVVALTVACDDGGPGALTITLDKLPEITNATSVTIAGSVTRVPAKNTAYFITITRGTVAIVDTVDSAGHFAFTKKLAADSSNSFTVSASDQDGSVATPVTVTLTQDARPPDIAKMTPDFEADLVPKSQTISFVLTEPAAPTYVTLLRQGVDNPGTLTMASDSVNGTFTPAAQLAPNSIYTFFFVGLKDRAGNRDTVGACFVTAGATTVSTDTSTGHYLAGAPKSALVPPVIKEARWARDNTLFTGVIRFVKSRSLALKDPTNVSVFLDLDIDQNSATGFKSYRDSALSGVGASAASGIGAEYIVAMYAIDAQGTGGGFAARYTAPITIDASSAVSFVQDVCGPFVGFNVPFTALGNDDGKLNYSVFATSEDDAGAFAEVMPTKGPLTIDASVGTGAPPIASAPPAMARRGAVRTLRRPPVLRTVRHR